jgi:hypothetical protein
MCLFIKQLCVQKAKKDITCFKVYVLDLHYNKNLVYSFYQRVPVKLRWNNVIVSDAFEKSRKDLVGSRKHITTKLPGYGIEIGIHSFARSKDAIKLIHDEGIYIRNTDKFLVVKCIIPKGTLYWTGIFGGDKSYASEKVIIKTIGEIIDWEEIEKINRDK